MRVEFFPRKQYSNVSICSHYHDKKMAFTEQTDTFYDNNGYGWVMPYAKEKGIKLGVFASPGNLNSTFFEDVVKEDLAKGHVWLDSYPFASSLSDKLSDPTHPKIEDEEWLNAYNDEILPIFQLKVGITPSAMSYCYANDTYQDIAITKFLGCRNSNIRQNTDYGFGFGQPNNLEYNINNFKSRASTMRWYPEGVGGEAALTGINNMSSLIDETITNGGWINNFTHWHRIFEEDRIYMYQYLDMLAEKNVNDEIWFCGYGEALSYLVYRDSIKDIAMYSPLENPNILKICVLKGNKYNVNVEAINTPVSVKFSTKGTILEGKNITCKDNIISIGDEWYIVDIPFSKSIVDIKEVE